MGSSLHVLQQRLQHGQPEIYGEHLIALFSRKRFPSLTPHVPLSHTNVRSGQTGRRRLDASFVGDGGCLSLLRNQSGAQACKCAWWSSLQPTSLAHPSLFNGYRSTSRCFAGYPQIPRLPCGRRYPRLPMAEHFPSLTRDVYRTTHRGHSFHLRRP